MAEAALLPCVVVHAIPGRVRIRVPWIKSRPRLADMLVDRLTRLAGIREVKPNCDCASMTVHYDKKSWEAFSLCLHIDSLASADGGGINAAKWPVAADDTSSAWYQLALSSLGLLTTWLKIPLAPMILPLCLAGSAGPMISRAYKALGREGRLTVDALDTSAAALLTAQGQFRMAMFMIWLVNIGDYIRDATIDRARATMESVLAYQASMAWVVRGKRKIKTPVDRLVVNDTVVVYPGDRIPVDGEVLSGMAVVDQRTLTGESMPIEKVEGSRVFASTVVHDGTLYIRTTQVGGETEAAKIVRLVEQAPAHETALQTDAEHWANDLVPYSFIGAGMRGLFGGGVAGAASVLVIDYGTGIRVAAPTAVLATMTKAARHGVLFKGGRSLEALAAVDAVVFDKTGTLSMGIPRVVAVHTYGRMGSHEVLAMAAAAEDRLNHPVAQAIVRAAVEARARIPAHESGRYSVGLGAASRINGSEVHVGCRRYMTQLGIKIPTKATLDYEAFGKRTVSPVCVAIDYQVTGIIGYADTMRPEASEVIRALRGIGIKHISMLTGDQQAVARHAANLLGIEHYAAELLPEQKVMRVKDLQRDGYRVAVVGDGINDSPALAHADVGIAVTGGADVARDTAHVVLLNGDLRSIPLAIEFARDAVTLIADSWRILSIPNTVALALACAGWLGPGMATLLSNGAAVVATGHALRPVWDLPVD